jgi:hypothetical protein
MSNLHFYDGRIQGTDGNINFDGPWAREGSPVNLPADKFVAALKLIKTPKYESVDGNLIVKGNGRRAKMTISTDAFPRCDKPPYFDPMDDSIREPLRKLRPFMGEDEYKLYSRTIMYSDGWLYATNNVTLVRVKWETAWDNFILPDFAMDLILRTPHEITAIHDSENAGGIEFGDYWAEWQKYVTQWPDVGKFFDYDFDKLPLLPEGLQQAVKDLLPFAPATGRVPVVRFAPGKVTTMTGESEAEIEMDLKIENESHFFAEQIIDVLGVADKMDLDLYPAAIPFSGDGVQGVTMGVRA